MEKTKTPVDPHYGWKSIAYNAKLDVYLITGPTGKDTRAYHVEEKKWREVICEDTKLFNGYLEYDDKTDLFGLVFQHQAFKFRYVPIPDKVQSK